MWQFVLTLSESCYKCNPIGDLQFWFEANYINPGKFPQCKILNQGEWYGSSDSYSKLTKTFFIRFDKHASITPKKVRENHHAIYEKYLSKMILKKV